MIRNIVFDLGNVLISFKPSDYLEKIQYPEEIRNTILTDIFGSNEWLRLDNGDISTEEAINAISEKSTLKKALITRIFNTRTEIFHPIRNNIKILPELKKGGFKLYYLSNFPVDIYDDVKNANSFFKFFDGGIISAEINISKPDIRIFRVFLEKFNLKPEECLYLDDIEKNVKSAVSAGMTGFTTFGSLDISNELFNILDHTSNKL
jgi:putative hydrolase of the HAD superfamily